MADGHLASSKLELFEGFVKKIVTAVQANPTLWASTAIFVTFDEGGGSYDSGYVQPIDFFDDSPAIPFSRYPRSRRAARWIALSVAGNILGPERTSFHPAIIFPKISLRIFPHTVAVSWDTSCFGLNSTMSAPSSNPVIACRWAMASRTDIPPGSR